MLFNTVKLTMTERKRFPKLSSIFSHTHDVPIEKKLHAQSRSQSQSQSLSTPSRTSGGVGVGASVGSSSNRSNSHNINNTNNTNTNIKNNSSSGITSTKLNHQLPLHNLYHHPGPSSLATRPLSKPQLSNVPSNTQLRNQNIDSVRTLNQQQSLGNSRMEIPLRAPSQEPSQVHSSAFNPQIPNVSQTSQYQGFNNHYQNSSSNDNSNSSLNTTPLRVRNAEFSTRTDPYGKSERVASNHDTNHLTPILTANTTMTSPTSNRLRRKPPSDLEEFNFLTKSLSPSSKLSDGTSIPESSKHTSQGTRSEVNETTLTDLENEIDNFLQLESSNTDGSSVYAHSDRRSSELPSLNGHESEHAQKVADPFNNFMGGGRDYGALETAPLNYQRTSAGASVPGLASGKASGIAASSTPYPLTSFLDTYSESVTPTDSVENSPQMLQRYRLESPEQNHSRTEAAFRSQANVTNASNAVNDSSSSSKSSMSLLSPTKIMRSQEVPSSTSMIPQTSSQTIPALPIQPTRSSYSRTSSSSRTQQSNRASSLIQANQSLPPAERTTSLQSTVPSLYQSSESLVQYPFNNTRTNSIGRQTSQTAFHRASSSLGSIRSANSYRNVNLAQLKRTISLKPGEGERSNYVLTIRRSGGTAFNEAGPSKWKLPVGILPIDKAATKENSNGKYKKLAGNSSITRKKSSGVELKHGHLKPRLLATEIDEGDNSTSLSVPKPPAPTFNSSSANTLKNVSSHTSLSAKASRGNSLKRTTTDVSLLTGDTQSLASTKSSSTKGRTETSLKRSDSAASSSSSGSLSNRITGYYQHRAYKYGDDYDDDDDDDNDDNDDYDDANEFGVFEDGFDIKNNYNGNKRNYKNNKVKNNDDDDDDNATETILDGEDQKNARTAMFDFSSDGHESKTGLGIRTSEEEKPTRLVLANPDSDSD